MGKLLPELEKIESGLGTPWSNKECKKALKIMGNNIVKLRNTPALKRSLAQVGKDICKKAEGALAEVFSQLKEASQKVAESSSLDALKHVAADFQDFCKDAELATRKLECEERITEIKVEAEMLWERARSRSLFCELWEAIAAQEKMRQDPEKHLDFRVWRASSVHACLQRCNGLKVFYKADEMEAVNALQLVMADVRICAKLRDGSPAPLDERSFLLTVGKAVGALLPATMTSAMGKKLQSEHVLEDLSVHVWVSEMEAHHAKCTQEMVRHGEFTKEVDRYWKILNNELNGTGRPSLPGLKDTEKAALFEKHQVNLTLFEENVKHHQMNFPIQLRTKADAFAKELKTEVPKAEKWKLGLNFKLLNEVVDKGHKFWVDAKNMTVLDNLKTTELALEDIIGNEGTFMKAVDFWKLPENKVAEFKLERTSNWLQLQLRIKAVSWEERIIGALHSAGAHSNSKYLVTNIGTIDGMYKGVTQAMVLYEGIGHFWFSQTVGGHAGRVNLGTGSSGLQNPEPQLRENPEPQPERVGFPVPGSPATFSQAPSR